MPQTETFAGGRIPHACLISAPTRAPPMEKLLEAEEQLASGVKPVPVAEAAAGWRALCDELHPR